MRTIPIALAPMYLASGATLCQCLRMTLRDGTVIGATTLDRRLVIDSVTYLPWLKVSDTVSTATLAVDNLENTVITDEPGLKEDIEAGRYDNATFWLFETNYLNPTDGIVSLKRGTTGEAKINDNGTFTIEFRGLTQALQQTVGSVTSRTCRAHFADYPRQALGNKCGLDAALFTVTGTATAVASRQAFTDLGRGEGTGASHSGTLTSVTDAFHFADSANTAPAGLYAGATLAFTSGTQSGQSRVVKTWAAGGAMVLLSNFPGVPSPGDAYTLTAVTGSAGDDWFTEGFVKFISGLNGSPAQYERQVKSFAAGVFTFVLPFPHDIAPGDAYSAIKGCRKRVEDCKANGNILNMQAEPYLPGADALTKVPGVGT